MKFRTETHCYFELPNGIEVELPFTPEDWLQDEIRVEPRADGGYRVAYLMHDDSCPNPLEDCDGMGTIYHHPNSHYSPSDGYYAALGLDRYGDNKVDYDKVQDAWYDAVMAIPAELFILPDEFKDERWEPAPLSSSKGDPIPYWMALRHWLAVESVYGDHPLYAQCRYAWDSHLSREAINAIREQIEDHLEFNYGVVVEASYEPIGRYTVLLDVYEHGMRSYSISGEGTQCRWDTSRGACVWVAEDKYSREEIDIRAKVYAFGCIVQLKSNKYYPSLDTMPIDSGGHTMSYPGFDCWRQAYKWLKEQIANLPEPTEAELEKGHNRALYEVARTCVAEYDKWQRGECYGVICVDYDENGEQVDVEDACWGFVGTDYAVETRDGYFEKKEVICA